MHCQGICLRDKVLLGGSTSSKLLSASSVCASRSRIQSAGSLWDASEAMCVQHSTLNNYCLKIQSAQEALQPWRWVMLQLKLHCAGKGHGSTAMLHCIFMSTMSEETNLHEVREQHSLEAHSEREAAERHNLSGPVRLPLQRRRIWWQRIRHVLRGWVRPSRLGSNDGAIQSLHWQQPLERCTQECAAAMLVLGIRQSTH